MARRPKPSLRAAGIALLGTLADIRIACWDEVLPSRCGENKKQQRSLESAMLDTALISIVDDDPPFRESMHKLVALLGYCVEPFSSAADFLASGLLSETACLIADVHMPGMTGVELHGRLINLGCAIPTILITAYPDEAVRDQALKDGVICYLSKPVDDCDLERCIRSALKRGNPSEENS